MNKGFKIFSFIVIILLIGLVALNVFSCFNVSSSKKAFDLSPAEIEVLNSKVEKGDSQAALRLAKFYFMTVSDSGMGYYYYEKAAFLDDSFSKKAIKGFLDTYGLEKYREQMRRTNSEIENNLMRIIQESNSEGNESASQP